MEKRPVQQQRLLLLLGVLLLGCGGAIWWVARSGTTQPAGAVQAVPATPAKPEPAIAVRSSGPASLSPPADEAPRLQALVSVEDRYAQRPVLELREEPPPTQARVRWTVTKLVRDTSFKYPLLRVVENWQQGPGGAVRLRQSAMVADHVLVRLKPSVRIEQLLERLKQLQPDIRRRLRASNLWIVSFESHGLDTVPQAI